MDPRRKTLLITCLAAAASVATLGSEHKPCRTSILSGKEWVKEILDGHPARVLEQTRMDKGKFQLLCSLCRQRSLLEDTPHIDVEEQIMIFFYIVGQNQSNRACQERFQHSGETINRYFKSVLAAFVHLHDIHIKYIDTDTTPKEIRQNPKFWPYFEGCIGAIDGTHIKATVPSSQVNVFRNRKGIITQNVMMACSFDLKFHYVLAGWEGSAHDGRVLEDAFTKGFKVPDAKYYLGDAGYANTSQILVPYRGIRYHLREWDQSNQRYDFVPNFLSLLFSGLTFINRPTNAKELFNLRHSMLRNAIERIFGILKKRFQILNASPSYPYQIQVDIILAVCFLHNFIGNGDDLSKLTVEEINELELYASQLPQDDSLEDPSLDAGRFLAARKRDRIAQNMWDDYMFERSQNR